MQTPLQNAGGAQAPTLVAYTPADRIAELERINANLRELAIALNVDCDVSNEQLLEMLTERDTLQVQLNNAHKLLDSLAWLLAEGVLTYKPEHPEDAEWFAEAEAALGSVHQYQMAIALSTAQPEAGHA